MKWEKTILFGGLIIMVLLPLVKADCTAGEPPISYSDGDCLPGSPPSRCDPLGSGAWYDDCDFCSCPTSEFCNGDGGPCCPEIITFAQTIPSHCYYNSTSILTIKDVEARITGTVWFNDSRIAFNSTSDGLGKVRCTGGGLTIDNGTDVVSNSASYESKMIIYDGCTFLARHSSFDEMGYGTGDNRYGLNVQSDNAIIVNNTFYDGKWVLVIGDNNYGVGLPSTPNTPKNILIENNSFVGTNVKSISVFGADNITIRNNTIKAFTISAIQVAQTTWTAGDFSVHYRNSTNLLVENNLISDVGKTPQYGIEFGGHYSRIKDNEITQIKYGQDTKSSTGIYIIGDNNNITDNVISEIGGGGGNEKAYALSIGGDYNFVNGTDCDDIGGGSCKDSPCISLTGDYNTIYNNTDMLIDADGGGCSFGYIITGDHNLIDDNAELGFDNFVGMWLEEAVNNTFRNLLITRTDDSTYGMDLQDSDDNYFDKIKVNLTSAISIGTYGTIGVNLREGSNNNIFVDSNLYCNADECVTSDGLCDMETYNYALGFDAYGQDVSGTSTNEFLNTTFPYACFVWSDKLYRQWYLSIYANDSNMSLPIKNANVTLWNNSFSWQFNELTDSLGWIGVKNITQYTQNKTAQYYQTDYIVNATKEYFSEYTNITINLTTNMVVYLQMIRNENNFKNSEFNSVLIIFSAGSVLVYLAKKFEKKHVALKFLYLGGGLFMFLLSTNTVLASQNILTERAYSIMIRITYITLAYFVLMFLIKSIYYFKDNAKNTAKANAR